MNGTEERGRGAEEMRGTTIESIAVNIYRACKAAQC